MMVTIKEIKTATATMPAVLAPIQTIKIGAKAVLGSAFKITNKGSMILANVSNHQSKTAMMMPKMLAIVKPKIVSQTEAAMWVNISPFFR